MRGPESAMLSGGLGFRNNTVATMGKGKLALIRKLVMFRPCIQE